jgi:hypothetical protein
MVVLPGAAEKWTARRAARNAQMLENWTSGSLHCNIILINVSCLFAPFFRLIEIVDYIIKSRSESYCAKPRD